MRLDRQFGRANGESRARVILPAPPIPRINGQALCMESKLRRQEVAVAFNNPYSPGRERCLFGNSILTPGAYCLRNPALLEQATPRAGENRGGLSIKALED
jgi:hypothetical protein